MRTAIQLEQGIIKYNYDWTGVYKLIQAEPKKRFFFNSVAQKTYYSSQQAQFDSTRPFIVTLSLSKNT